MSSLLDLPLSCNDFFISFLYLLADRITVGCYLGNVFDDDIFVLCAILYFLFLIRDLELNFAYLFFKELFAFSWIVLKLLMEVLPHE